MKKRFLSGVMALTVVAAMALTGCGNSGGETTTAAAEKTTKAAAETEKDTDAETEDTEAVSGAETDGADDASLQKVLDTGEFVLGLDATFKPMGYTDENDEIVGFDIDVAEAVCEKLGVKLVKQPINWETKEQDLDLGKIDCIWNGMSVNASREEAMNLSDPYLRNDMIFVVNGDSTVVAMSDLEGKTIAVQNGSTAQEILENSDLADSITITALATNVEALQQLDLGLVDAVFMDDVVADYEIKNSGKDYKKLEEGLYEEEYAIGFRKGDQALRDEVQKVLGELKADGTLGEISTKWFGSDITIVE